MTKRQGPWKSSRLHPSTSFERAVAFAFDTILALAATPLLATATLVGTLHRAMDELSHALAASIVDVLFFLHALTRVLRSGTSLHRALVHIVAKVLVPIVFTDARTVFL